MCIEPSTSPFTTLSCQVAAWFSLCVISAVLETVTDQVRPRFKLQRQYQAVVVTYVDVVFAQLDNFVLPLHLATTIFILDVVTSPTMITT